VGRVLRGDPATALVAAAEEAALVVIGRRRHGVPAALHLGGTARAVLRSASCPVRVVPPDLAGSGV
jgi:nucleotide-binding universal stress UspA family protein